MITTLLADATAGVSPEVVGGIIVAVLSAYGGWYAKGVKSSQPDSDTKRIYLEDKFATREEVAELKALQAKTTDDIHKRLNGITVKLNDMSGSLTLMIDILKSRKSL